jgi:hypothetical protein
MLPGKNKYNLIFLIFFYFTGCVSVTFEENIILEGNRCNGEIEARQEGLVEVTDNELLEKAVRPINIGGICTGKVYQANKPVTVYRVWNKENAGSEIGRWWTFKPPTGTRENYRKDYDICKSWNALNRMTSCTIKIGAKIVVGPGQSAYCKKSGTIYPQSPFNQVYIDNDRGEPLVENCKPSIKWPEHSEN